VTAVAVLMAMAVLMAGMEVAHMNVHISPSP
jgi:hypothetical protein